MTTDQVTQKDGEGGVQTASNHECPSCGSQHLKTSYSDNGDLCAECGVVVSNYEGSPVDEGAEATNSSITPESWKEQHRVTNSTEKQVAQALEFLEGLGQEIELSSELRQRVAEVYANAAIDGITDGRQTKLVIAGAILSEAREMGQPYPLGFLASRADLSRSSLSKMSRLLNRELDTGHAVCQPEEYLPFLGSELDLEKGVIASAVDRLGQLGSDECKTGINPVGLAGAALYLAAEGEVTQQAIASVAGVSGETIRLRVKECREASGGS